MCDCKTRWNFDPELGFFEDVYELCEYHLHVLSEAGF